ncbi:MAG TPA: thiamine ABC transporter substrate-binding protein [Anaerolineales bacterium]|nr:thiamine ABC transporter substrate-binding protein [Anaerolineales bacterium]
MKKITWILILVLTALLSACASAQPETPAEPQVLRVMTHDSFEVSEEVLAQFEGENNVTVEFLKSGDTGSAVNAAVLAAGKPLADVFYGVDNTFLSRALDEAIFEPYQSPLLDEIPDEFKLDPDFGALPVDYGDVCLNYDLAYFEDAELAPPASLDELLKPEYAGLLAVPNPAASSPGLAFLLATIGTYGQDGYLDYWQGLVDNDLSVVADWETIYYSEFSRWGGPRPIIVSYGSSPPVEIIFAEEPMDTPPTGVVTAAGSCFRQIEFVGILRGTEQRELAEKWVDFMLSLPFQEDLPLQMYVFPVRPDAELNQVFVDFLAVPDDPVILDPAEIGVMRETWLEDWREVVFP